MILLWSRSSNDVLLLGLFLPSLDKSVVRYIAKRAQNDSLGSNSGVYPGVVHLSLRSFGGRRTHLGYMDGCISAIEADRLINNASVLQAHGGEVRAIQLLGRMPGTLRAVTWLDE